MNKESMTAFFSPVDEKIYTDLIFMLKEQNIEVNFKIFDLYSKSAFVKVEQSELAIIKKFSYEYDRTHIFCFFILNGEYYFFKSRLNSSSSYFLLRYPNKIYKIQRRNDFRFYVPEKLDYKLKIHEFPSYQCILKDISLGGCKIEIKTKYNLELKVEDDITIYLEMLNLEQTKFLCNIAFTKFLPASEMQILGLKFFNVDAETTSLLHKSLMHLDRISRGKSDIE